MKKMRGFYGRKLLGLDELECEHSFPTAIVFAVVVIGAALFVVSYLAMRGYALWRANSPPPPTPYDDPPNAVNYRRRDELNHTVWLIRGVGLPRSVIESMETVSYQKGEGMFVESCDCSVCLSEFEDGERVKVLPKCKHVFHVACIDPWLGSHTNCPICRASVLLAEEGNGEITDPGEERLVIDQEMEPAVTATATATVTVTVTSSSVSLDSSSNGEGEKGTSYSTA